MKTIEISTVSAGKHTCNNQAIQIGDSLRVEEELTPLTAGGRRFRIVNQKDGDERVVWDGGSFAAIREAKELFDKLVAQGLVPYRADAMGKKTPEVMTEFDAAAEEVIFLPIQALVGG